MNDPGRQPGDGTSIDQLPISGLRSYVGGMFDRMERNEVGPDSQVADDTLNFEENYKLRKIAGCEDNKRLRFSSFFFRE